jgi:hypothetical protein
VTLPYSRAELPLVEALVVVVTVLLGEAHAQGKTLPLGEVVEVVTYSAETPEGFLVMFHGFPLLTHQVHLVKAVYSLRLLQQVRFSGTMQQGSQMMQSPVL